MVRLRRFVKWLLLKCGDRINVVFRLRQRAFPSPDYVYMLMRKPLGLGDIMMLAPFFIKVASIFRGSTTYLVTEHPRFMDLPGVTWIKPCDVELRHLRNCLVISPTLSWRHLPFILGAKWVIGYFFSNQLVSNFSRTCYSYDARRGHYFERAEHILRVLNQDGSVVDGGLSYGKLLLEPLKEEGVSSEYICVAPYSNWAERQYPEEYYKRIIAELRSKYHVVLVGGKGVKERKMAESLSEFGVKNFVGKTTLGEVATLLAGARLFIGNDSGLSHMAILCGTPSIIIYGCVGPEQRLPLVDAYRAKVIGLGAGEGCPYFPCYDGFNKPSCTNTDRYICLWGVLPEEVIAQAERALKMWS